MSAEKVVVIGAGAGGLACAARLAAAGCAVTLVERADRPGGKMSGAMVSGAALDAGPTVLTMRFVFDELFEACGEQLDDAVRLVPLATLARHAWTDGARLDLFADLDASAEAIAAFAGPREARAFRTFQRDAARMFATLRDTFLRASKPNPISLTGRVGLHRLPDLLAIRPFDTLASALAGAFRDPRLRQLYGRYATYSGASPYLAPATLMLIAHVEQAGVWRVEGGMRALAAALGRLAEKCGARTRYGAGAARIETRNGRASAVRLDTGETLPADAVVFAGDSAALRMGLLGPDVARAGPATPRRSLSAVTWTMRAEARGFPLAHHSVFFGDDYRDEFDAVFTRGVTPPDPTIYICAQDRRDGGEDGATASPGLGAGPERLLILVNAPARGAEFGPEEIAACATTMTRRLAAHGLTLSAPEVTTTGPAQFAARYPGSQGALYGPATHGWAAAFQRPGARTAIPNLYLAGGTTHPGAGVPMAALSGAQASQALLFDRASTRRSRPAAMRGGTSTPSATTAATP